MTRSSLRALTGGAAAVAALLALVACSPGSEGPTSGQAAVSVDDATGAEVALAEPAARVVCLDGTCLDAMAELGLAPVAALEQQTAKHPAFFGTDANIDAIGGTFFEPNLEEIVAAEPDLVVGSASVHATLRDGLGDIPFYGQSLGDLTADENLLRLGTLTGREAEAEAAVEHWQQVLADYRPGDREVTVLSMYGGATQDVGIDAADSAVGALVSQYTAYPWPAAAEGDSGFLEMSLEEVLTIDPAHIWVLDFGFDPDAPPLIESLADNPAWLQLTAVGADNVHLADAAWWGTAAGTRAQQLMLDTVMPTVYPDEFPEPLSGLPQS